MPLSEKPIHHEPHVEPLNRSRDENAPQRQSFGASDPTAPQLGVPGAQEQQRDTFQQKDDKQERDDFKESPQQGYLASKNTQEFHNEAGGQQFFFGSDYTSCRAPNPQGYKPTEQHFDATLPATVIVERETEPTRTIVEYERAPMETAGGTSFFGERRPDREFTQTFAGAGPAGAAPTEFRGKQDFTTEQRGFTERQFGGSTERQFGASPNENIAASYGSMEGAEPVRREQGSLSDSERLDAQGKHFQGMMDQEIKDEEAFEEGRRHVRQEGSPQRRHHHHHHHHRDVPRDDERGAAQESNRGLNSNPSDRDLPQTHSSAAAHNADTNQVKPAPSGAAQPPPFDKEAPAPLADKAPANPKDAFPESKNQPIKGDTGASSTMDSNQSSAGRRDTQPTDTHPNPNTTGAKDGTSGRSDGGMDQPHQLPKEGNADLSQNKGTADAALSKDRLPKEGADSGSKPTGLPATGSRPPGSADRVAPPATGGAGASDLPKDKLNGAPPGGAPLDSRPPGSADRVAPAPGGVGAAGSTAPPGVPPGSTAPLPPAATSDADLDKDEDEENHKGGMRGKMHDMKEKMKETLHMGHHKDEKDEKDPHLKDETATGGPITTTK